MLGKRWRTLGKITGKLTMNSDPLMKMRAHTLCVNNVFYEFLENISMKATYLLFKNYLQNSWTSKILLTFARIYSGRFDSTIWSVFKNVSVVEQTDVIIYNWVLSIFLYSWRQYYTQKVLVLPKITNRSRMSMSILIYLMSLYE